MTGDRSLKNEGRADQAKAKVKDTVDKAADGLRDAVDKAAGVLTGHRKK